MATTVELKPGDEAQSWCTKCREMRLHKVKALVPGKVPRVICVVCDGEHNFRPQPPKSTRSKKRSKADEPNPWKELTTDVREDRIIPYSISESFGEGDFIQHRRYGLGVVTEVLDASKMIVAFEDKKRVMVCNK